jgi:hypothetical protein
VMSREPMELLTRRSVARP